MATKIYTISLPIELAEWYDKNNYISLSKITQEELIKIKRQREEITKDLDRLNLINEKLKEKIQEANEFIANNNLWEDFCRK